MAEVRCPACRTPLDVPDRLLAEPVSCGACGTVFDPTGGPPPLARRAVPVDDDYDEYEELPRRRRRRRYEDYDSDDDWPRPDATPAHLPALLSTVLCLLLLVVLGIEIAMAVAMPQAVQNNPLIKALGGKPPPIEFVIGIRVFGVVYVLTVLTASFRMMSGRNYRFAVAGMVMHILFLCGGLCYPFGLAVGIWGLVILNRPDVKAGFALNDRRPAAEDVDDDRL